jgi:hypothetical protein
MFGSEQFLLTKRAIMNERYSSTYGPFVKRRTYEKDHFNIIDGNCVRGIYAHNAGANGCRFTACRG